MASSLVKTFVTKFAKKLEKHAKFANLHNVKPLRKNFAALRKGNESANPADPAGLNHIVSSFFFLVKPMRQRIYAKKNFTFSEEVVHRCSSK